MIAKLFGLFQDPTVWRKDLRLPDGAWVATARTEQWGGFGMRWVQTTISLRKADKTVYRGKPFDIFSYPGGGSIPRTYVLSDENEDEDLRVVWLTPKHLEIGHGPTVYPNLAVIRLSDIDISYERGGAVLPP